MFRTQELRADAVVLRTLPPLPLDVLYAVATFSRLPEVSALMRTCQTLYHEGAKIILHRGAALWGPKELASFVMFINAEELSRCRHLRGLSISDFYELGTLVDGAGHGLAAVLAANSFESLRRLYLGHAEVVFRDTQELITAFANLPSLKAIALNGCGDLSITFLKGIKSKLTTPELTYLTEVDQDSRSDYHPVVALQNVRETLQMLRVSEVTSSIDLALSFQPYPNLDVLVIGGSEYPVLGPYIRFCPNVKKLHIFISSYEQDDEVYLEELDDFRDINVEYQTQHGTWDRLEEVAGGVHDIYTTGLSCPIGELSMRLGARDRFDDVIPTLLAAAQVDSLTLLTAKPHAFDGDSGLPLVLRALPEASPDLKSLNLHMQISCPNEELRSALGYILGPIAHLKICTFVLTLDLEETPDLRGSPVDRFLAHFDFAQCARDVLSSSTTLKEVEIEMLAHPSRGTVTAYAPRE
ncbi:hypothetical protein K466DRAFT_651978 [Polyporus arcularius HHB13444]|uniref:F-box domain-containing protein n=1 Tax=Polyporus arcularius HHB13444 TaxID=1314778 RepID=A0A5C3PJA2_9APHY|nr:hypothetical protein K466DRAFT_651978 [Polyporus arcularius HHB13444]